MLDAGCWAAVHEGSLQTTTTSSRNVMRYLVSTMQIPPQASTT